MSYLDVPRLHFFGTFTANPSTLNNDPLNYSELQPPFEPPPALDEGWNPNGSHAWTFEGCTVQTVIGPDGSPLQDPLVGTAVSSAATAPNSSPKLVDLDTQQQMVSMIFGLQIQVGDSASGTVTGNFQPQPFNDIAQGPRAYYQSVLQDLTWSSYPASPVLQELQRISPDALSIKFVVKQTPTPNGQPARGSITGTIGPAYSGEPANFLLGRLMRPTGSPARLAFRGHVPRPIPNYTPFVVNGDRGKVTVDFGNSFQAFDLGTMEVAISPSQGPPQILGPVDYTAASYQATAAIQEFDVTAEQISLLQSSILVVLFDGSSILAEDPNATSLAVTPMVCRLNPGESVQIDLVALSFGAPAANQTIDIQQDTATLLPQPPQYPPVGTPEGALQITPTTVTTDANGRASFTLAAAPEGPDNPRGNIDGQVYGVGFTWSFAADLDSNVFVSVRVFDLVSVPDSPDWESNVLPILGPYRDLYPFMNNPVGINLADQGSVLQNATEIAFRLQLPTTDPRQMPVTRDLSASKRQIVLTWLAQQTQSGQGGTAGG